MFEFFYKPCMKIFSPGSLKEISQIGEIEEKPSAKYMEGKWLSEQLEQKSDPCSITVKEQEVKLADWEADTEWNYEIM